MNERELKRMQHDPGRRESHQLFQPAILSLAVSQVARERESEELKVHADLMSPARV